MQWHLSNALEKKKRTKVEVQISHMHFSCTLVNQQITIRGRSETRKQVCNVHLMFWRVLIRFLTDIISLKVEELSLNELCTQVRQQKKNTSMNHFPIESGPIFSQMCLKILAKFLVIFFVEIKNTKGTPIKKYSNERLIFLWFVLSALNEKGFSKLNEKIKTSKKTHVNDVLGYSFFLKLRTKVEIKIDIKRHVYICSQHELTLFKEIHNYHLSKSRSN